MAENAAARGRRIERALLLDAAPADVYALLTDAPQVASWFAPTVESRAARAGGLRSMHIEWDRGGRKVPDDLEVVEESPFDGKRARFAFEWSATRPLAAAGPEHTTRATFELTPEAGGTRLVLDEGPFPDGPDGDFAVRRHGLGWDVYLPALAARTGSIPTRVITAARLMPAGAAQAWHLMTKKEALGLWINDAEEWDARPGGAWRLVAKSGAVGSGRFTRVEPLRELAFTWRWYEQPLAPTHASLTLEETEDGALMRVVHHGWGFGEAWDHEINDCRNGWDVCLSSLATLLRSPPASIPPRGQR